MNSLLLLSAATLIVASFALVPSSLAQDHSAHGATTGSAASTQYMDAMKKMDMDMAAMTMSGKPGPDFATMMIPHHQAAIDMAKSYLASGDGELTKLSNEIIAAQEREIAFLKDWLAKNGQ